MFEAARWAPSARNYQPWYFYWMRRGSKAHEKLVSCVAERHHWVKSAPVIILACYDPLDPKDGTKNRWAIYDLGAAVISLVLQAHELGYFCRQIGSFDAEKAKTNLGLDPRWTPFVSVAVGKIGSYVGVDPTYGEMDKQATPRKTDLAQKLE
jgi:nitroreductase